MCHKYRQIGRIDKDGIKRSYYVDENIYDKTTHRNVPCRDCHDYIDKLPHDPVTREVDCSNDCHIKRPFAKDNFSHKKLIKIYNSSVHAIKPDDPDDVKKAKPYCKYCHTNPLYRSASEEQISPKSLLRCFNCHQKKGVEEAFRHVTHRLRHKTTRSPQEIVKLCSRNCHENVELMKTFKVSEESLIAVKSYKKSFHGKAVSLGSKEAADCISCHATNAIHDIYKKDDPRASIYERNKIATCKQCHTKVDKYFIQIDTHSKSFEENPILHFVELNLTFALYGTLIALCSLMILETIGRRRGGIKWLLKNGSSWRR